MMQKLRSLSEYLRSSLWVMPCIIVVSAIILALGLIELDASTSNWRLAERWPRLFGAGADGSRGLLSAIASSMITVAGVTFSITIVALALASSQYTSRILRNFMRDRASQSVLGVFVGVFVYCLIVLRTIRGGEETVFVPALAITGALLLALVAIGCLIFFIHHIAASIQASSIIATAANETLHAIDRLFPKEIDAAASCDRAAIRAEREVPGDQWAIIPAGSTGYIQAVDTDALAKLASEMGAVVRLGRGVGDFVIQDEPLASMAGTHSGERVVDRFNAAFTVGRHRTLQQDVAYGIRQIVDIALKALSPGINDSTTAVNCVDYLGAILARIAPRSIEVEGGQLLVVARGPTFGGLLGEAFDQIRQNAEGNVAVLTRLLEVLDVVAGRTSDAMRRRDILEQVRLISETVQRTVPLAHDRAAMEARIDRFPGS